MEDHDTAPHDVGEWLGGYARGVNAGRKDVLGMVSELLGKGPLADWILSELLRRLEKGTPR